VAIATFLPFYFLVITSFKNTSQMTHYFLRPVLPLHIENYGIAFRQLRGYFLNSVIVTSSSVVGVLAVSSLSAYAFARYSFIGKTVLFYAVITMLMVPAVLTLVPRFVWVKQLGLLNTHWALVLPYITGGQVFAIYLLRSFYAALPQELFDSAEVDGAGMFRTYMLIALPLCKPVLSIIAVMNTLSTWNDFIWPLVTLTDNSKRTVTVGLQYFVGQFQTNFGPLFAGYILASLPLLILFAFAMRPFVAGLTSGAIKM
jgi:ABC-type glycerol-3-phosphate transport system permease component